MQTFLPYSDFKLSVQCLDNKRLGKQRLECKQILQTLDLLKKGITRKPNGKKIGWINHPAVRMWKDYEEALKLYMNECIDEWVSRGYKNTMQKAQVNDVVYPTWFGNDKLHKSHRSNLLRKKPEFYQKYEWKESADLSYIWPV